jgi:tRNA dimethylallyltransferase
MSKAHPPLAVIAGPTASGKSALAMELARRTNGVIVNADSAQLYRDIPIISAAPTTAERAEVEHRLYGVRSGDEPCSAAEWAAMARSEIAAIHAHHRLPILVGGTGLYLRTLLDGIAPVPAINPAVRKAIRAATVEQNHAELEQVDPEAAARLNPGDTTRIARALEVVRSTGKPLAYWQAKREGGILDQISLKPLILFPPRDWLVARCDERFSEMIEEGAIEEVRRLLDRRLDPALPVMRAIGVAEIAGETDPAAMIERSRISTRRYAKRQYTWFGHQPPPDWARFTEPLDTPGAMGRALALLGVQG